MIIQSQYTLQEITNNKHLILKNIYITCNIVVLILYTSDSYTKNKVLFKTPWVKEYLFCLLNLVFEKRRGHTFGKNSST